MKRSLLLTLLTAAVLAGCDRDDGKSAEQVPAASQSTPAAVSSATAPVETDPVIINAGLHLNEAQDLLNSGDYEGAEAKLKPLDAVRDKLRSDYRDKLDSLDTVLNMAKKVLKGTTRPQ